MPVDVVPNLPAGKDVLLDANIFIYAFSRRSTECHRLLKRCSREEVFGITTVEIINEVTHRMMLAEAIAKNIISRDEARLLRGNPAAIKSLADYWIQTSRIFTLNILILGLEDSRLKRAGQLRAVHGLLTNDSVILAALDEFGIECLASRDDDFDHVPGITVYKPTDLPRTH